MNLKVIHNNQKHFLGTALILLTGLIHLQAAVIKLTIIDGQTKEKVPARVLMKSEDKICWVPENAVRLKIASEQWFISPGESEIKVSAKSILLRVERGKEYKRVKRIIDLSGKEESEITVVLERWINMKEHGYLSGENHLHLDAQQAAAMASAEDLDFACSLQWWNRPRFGVPQGRGYQRTISFGDQEKVLSIYDVELEEAWGALYLLNLSHPFPFLNDPQMPNLVAAVCGRQDGTLNCYQSGWSREVLIDALLGYVDVVNVCNNNFHMHRFQPRSNYSNLLNVKGLPEYPATEQGMMQMNMDTYYRLLNCGIRLAAGAGSATGVKEVPAGYNRSYVKCSPDSTISGFTKNWRKGHNFVTNGPMLFFRINQLETGDSLHISGSQKVKYSIEARSDSPLSKVEIVSNGKVIKGFTVPDNTLEFTDNGEVEVTQSAWICARCSDSDMLLNDEELAEYKSPPVKLNQEPSRLRFAHTSPLYIIKDGEEITVQESILEGLKMIAAFEQFADTTASDKYRPDIIEASQKARQILEKRLNP